MWLHVRFPLIFKNRLRSAQRALGYEQPLAASLFQSGGASAEYFRFGRQNRLYVTGACVFSNNITALHAEVF